MPIEFEKRLLEIEISVPDVKLEKFVEKLETEFAIKTGSQADDITKLEAKRSQLAKDVFKKVVTHIPGVSYDHATGKRVFPGGENARREYQFVKDSLVFKSKLAMGKVLEAKLSIPTSISPEIRAKFGDVKRLIDLLADKPDGIVNDKDIIAAIKKIFSKVGTPESRSDILSELLGNTSIDQEILIKYLSLIPEFYNIFEKRFDLSNYPLAEDPSVPIEKEPEIKPELDITIKQFESFTFEEQKKWVFTVLDLIKNGDDISLSDKANKGMKLYGKIWTQVDDYLKSKDKGSEEAKLQRWVESALKLNDAVYLSTAAYCVDYNTLVNGGNSPKDSTVNWGGLKGEGGEFLLTRHLKTLLSESTELEVGDAAKTEFLIDVLYSWFRGEPYPNSNPKFIGPKYSQELRMGHGGKDQTVHNTLRNAKIALHMEQKDIDNDSENPFAAMSSIIGKEAALSNAIDEIGVAIGAKDHIISAAKQMTAIFDLRGIVAQNNYAAASSPADRGTIYMGKFTELFNRAAMISYGTMGKNKGGMFNPDLVLSVLPRRAVDAMRARGKDHDKGNNVNNVYYLLQLQVARVWLEYYAPAPKELLEGLIYDHTDAHLQLSGGAKQRNFYTEDETRHRYNPFPRMGEYLWLDLQARNLFLDEDKDFDKTILALKYYGEDMETYKNFIEAAINGENLNLPAISNDMDYRDVEEIMREKVKLISALSQKFSALKPLMRKEENEIGMGIDSYSIAKAWYIYIRQIILAFGEACWGKVTPEKQNLYVAKLCSMICDTMPNTLADTNVHDPAAGKMTNMTAFLLDRIPYPKISINPLGQRVVGSWLVSGRGKPLDSEWVNAIYYNGDRTHNNEHKLTELKGPGEETHREKFSLWIRHSVMGLKEATKYLSEDTGFVKDNLVDGYDDSRTSTAPLGFTKSGDEKDSEGKPILLPITEKMLWERVEQQKTVASVKGKEAIDGAKEDSKDKK